MFPTDRRLILLTAVILLGAVAAIVIWMRQGLPTPAEAERASVAPSVVEPMRQPDEVAVADVPPAPPSPPTPSDDPIADQVRWGQFHLEQQLPALAVKHFYRAALCGDIASQSRLAGFYAAGEGVSPRLDRALLWASLAADLGLAEEGLSSRIEQYRAGLSEETLQAVAEAVELWLIRRPDQTLACQAAAMPPDSDFQAGLFALD